MKTNKRFISLKAVLFSALVITLSASAIAQIPDYNFPQNWMCHPVLKTNDVARQQNLALTVLNSDGSIKTDTIFPHYADTLVDIFYVYPTIDTTLSFAGNTEINNNDTITAKIIYREQVGIYAQFGRVFVPYYRQANLRVFVDPTLSLLDQANYMEFAYKDVEAAFDNYLLHYNNGHRIILMGHSQGAYLMRFLLRKRFDNNPTLTSQLVVAISGGEPNYSAKGSRTGGSLQNIKTLDSVAESGCMINWRTWNSDSAVQELQGNSFFFNHYFVDKGLIYQTYDTVYHQESNYNFGYVPPDEPKKVTRYISLAADTDTATYLGFDDMFRAQVTPPTNIPGGTYLLIDTINYFPQDQRTIPYFPRLSGLLQSQIPIPAGTKNYHIWDMQFVQGDLLNLLPELIAITNPSTSVPEVADVENSICVYPNPTTDIVHLSNVSSRIKSIRLCNLQGKLIQEFFTNDFSVSSLAAGIYFISIQTDKSSVTSKLVKR